MLKTYQYRLYPSLHQKQILSIQFGHNRFVWNNTLNYLQGEYQKYLSEKENNPQFKRTFINLGDIIKRLPVLKQEIEWLSLAHSQTLQATMKRLDQSFQMFFKNKGLHPKFKRKTNEQSIEFPQQTKIDFNIKCVKLPKIGYAKIALDRVFSGIIKTCEICGTIHDRDINASINICEAGYDVLDRFVGEDYFTSRTDKLNSKKKSRFKKKTLDEGFATLQEIESEGINQLEPSSSILLTARNDKT